MSDAVRWTIVIACALVLLGMMAYARGPNHRHGNTIGSHGTRVVVIVRH